MTAAMLTTMHSEKEDRQRLDQEKGQRKGLDLETLL